MADIPGLIEGAHQGSGLGHSFLRHIERTRVIVHMIDIMPLDGQPEPAEAYRVIREELQAYSPKLASKPEIVVANKMDLCEDDRELETLRAELGKKVLGISGVSGHGLSSLHERIWGMLEEAKASEDSGEDATA